MCPAKEAFGGAGVTTAEVGIRRNLNFAVGDVAGIGFVGRRGG
jgi:hypothetical protein